MRASGLSFATDLWSDLKSVQRRSVETQAEYGDLVKAMKELAAVEESYGVGLRRVASYLRGSSDGDDGVLDALGALRSNLNHSAEMHVQLSTSIATEVAGPLNRAKVEAQSCGKALASRCATASRQIKSADDRYRKAASRSVQLMVEEKSGLEAASAAGATEEELLKEPASPPAPKKESSSAYYFNRLNSLGSSVRSSKSGEKSIEQWLLPNENEKRETLISTAITARAEASKAREAAEVAWKDLGRDAKACLLEAQRVLSEFQQIEETAVADLRDALRKLCVFESSALSNRHYDLQALARVLDDVDSSTELVRFIKATAPSVALSSEEGEDEPIVVVDALSLFPPVASSSVFTTPTAAQPSPRHPDHFLPLAVQPAKRREREHLASATSIFSLLDKASLIAATAQSTPVFVPTSQIAEKSTADHDDDDRDDSSEETDFRRRDGDPGAETPPSASENEEQSAPPPQSSPTGPVRVYDGYDAEDIADI